jgi:hypothetical protein
MSAQSSQPDVPQSNTDASDAFWASSKAGMAAIRAGLDRKRAAVKEAKLSCEACMKQETTANPLQACSRCRCVPLLSPPSLPGSSLSEYNESFV